MHSVHQSCITYRGLAIPASGFFIFRAPNARPVRTYSAVDPRWEARKGVKAKRTRKLEHSQSSSDR